MNCIDLTLGLWAISLLLLKISSLVGLGLATLRWKNQPTKHQSPETSKNWIYAPIIWTVSKRSLNIQSECHFLFTVCVQWPTEYRTVVGIQIRSYASPGHSCLDRFGMNKIFVMSLFFIKRSRLVWIQFTLDQPTTIRNSDTNPDFKWLVLA